MAASIPLLPEFFLRLIERWADKKQPEASHIAQIERQRLYIIPSQSGMIFFFVLLIIFIGAVNYENNMAFLLCFLLLSISLLSMFYTHQNINHLQLQISSARPVFSGQTAHFPVQLSHKNPQASIYIQLEADKNRPIVISQLKQNQPLDALLPVKTQSRGRISLPRIKVFTEYPLGLFYAWSWVRLSADCIVYPKPSYTSSANYTNSQTQGRLDTRFPGQDDFNSLREYMAGDNPSHIAWKSYARSMQLYSKTFLSYSQQEICIDWFKLDDKLSQEEKLSVLCRQIIDAEQANASYSLQLPQQIIKHSSGQQHRQLCLQSLALF